MKRLFCLLSALALLLQLVHAAQPPQRYLALTVDDGPSGELTEQLLEGLAARPVSYTHLRKGRLVTIWCVLPLILGGNQCFRRRSTRESPHGRLGTCRLIRE